MIDGLGDAYGFRNDWAFCILDIDDYRLHSEKVQRRHRKNSLDSCDTFYTCTWSFDLLLYCQS